MESPYKNIEPRLITAVMAVEGRKFRSREGNHMYTYYNGCTCLNCLEHCDPSGEFEAKNFNDELSVVYKIANLSYDHFVEMRKQYLNDPTEKNKTLFDDANNQRIRLKKAYISLLKEMVQVGWYEKFEIDEEDYPENASGIPDVKRSASIFSV